MRVVGLILLGLLCVTAWSAEVAPEPVKMDVFGDPVPPGALWRAGSSRFFSAGEVQTVAYSPSSKFFATANDRGTISLWDPESGKVLRDLQAPAPDEENPPTISELIFTPDESLLLAREDKGVRVWHLNGTKEHFFIEKDGAELKSMMALSPDGKRLALCFDSTLYLYETATGQLVETVKEGATLNQPPYALIFSADGRSLVLARKFEPPAKKEEPGEKEPEKKEAEKTEPEKEKNTPATPVVELAPKPDAPQVTEYSVLEWIDAATLKTIRTSKEVAGEVNELVVSPDNRYVATQTDELKLWNAATGELIKTDDTKKRSFGELKFTPDSKWLAGIGEQEHVALLTLPGLQTLNTLYFGLYESSYSSFAFAPDMKHMVLAGSDRPLRMLSLEQGMGWVRHENVDLPGSFQGFTFSPDAKTLVAGCENKSLHFVDIETHKETRTILNMAWDATTNPG